MVRRSLLLCLPFILLLPTTGCLNGGSSMTPEKRKEIAEQAGQVAALSYLAIEKPSVDQAKAIKMVIDEVTKSLNAYEEGGFKTALPKLKEAIAKAFPGEEKKALRLLADKLAETLVSELDALFDRHPDWKKLGNEVAGIIASFTTGASKGFKQYIEEA